MSVKNWQQIETLFHTALDLSVTERHEYLTRCCAGDESLRREVESLLESLDTQDEFFEEPVFETGIGLMGKTDIVSLTGKTIGSYVIREKLGSGGMGEVYLAEDTQLDRKVALKFLSQAFVNDKWAKRQLIKEARAAAMLDNRNICAVYGFEEVGEFSFIVMQYVAGQTLAELITKRAIAQTEILPIVEQILEALATAHAHGIIHRDIKPGNIILTPDGQVKVLDFGLAKLINPKNSPAGLNESLTQTSKNGFIVGTVAYMSPEQLRGEKLDFRSDIFSFGILLFELVTGSRPFDRKSDAETISAILTAPVPPLKSSADAAPGVEHLIYKCLEKDKEQRYQSASEMQLDLQNPVVPGWTAKFFAAHKKGVLTFSLLLIMLISLGFQQAGISDYFGENNARRLAVLPIINQSSDSGLDYLGEGITESLINRLAKSSELRVKPYTSVSIYKSEKPDYLELARELEVENIVVCKFIKRDDKILLQSSLISVVDNSKTWNDEIPFDPLNSLSVEEQLSEKVVSQLALDENESNNDRRRETRNPEAFRYYLLGQHHWRNRSKETIPKAIEAFSEAIRIDPNYARAYAGLTNAYIVQSNPSYGAVPAQKAMEKAKESAKKALYLDDNLAESHTAMAVVSGKYDYDWREAELEFKRAIFLNPEYAQAHYWYSEYLATRGLTDEALAEAEKAKQLDPFSPAAKLNIGRILYYGRRHEEAAIYFNEIINKEPNNLMAIYLLALVFMQIDMYPEAIYLFEMVYNSKKKELSLASLGFAYGKTGRHADARRILSEMDVVFPGGVPPQEKAIVHIGLGEKEKAIDYLKDAYKQGLSTLTALKVEPLYDDLRSEQGFKELLFSMRLY
jgi:serine/threonine protein kinase